MSNIGTCSCGDGSSINNYADPKCLKGLDVAEDVIFVPLELAAGGVNGIDLVGDTLDQSFFDLKFNAVEVRDRWLMVKDIEDFQSTPADSNVFTYPSGRTRKLSDGIRLVVMTLPTDDPYKLKAKLDTLFCRKIGVMYKDRNKSLVGQVSGDNFIAREISQNSLDIKAFDKTDTEDSRVEISFQYARIAKDADVDFIEEASMGGYSLDSVTPLQDVNAKIITASLTELVVELSLDWGGAKSRIPVGGLALLLDVTKDEVVEPTSSVTESVAGTYVFTYTTPLSGGEVVEARGILGVYVQADSDLKRLIGVNQVASA